MPPGGEALLDHYLPRFDVSEHHSIYVDVSPEAAFSAILSAPLAESPIVRGLLQLRALPEMLLGKKCQTVQSETATVLDLIGNGFFLVDEQPGREIVLGTIGRFWRLRGTKSVGASAEDLAHPLRAGTAAAVWNFRVARYAHGTRIHTETRVLCADEDARRSFRRYWRIIGPFSALIRRSMLESIKDEAIRIDS